jgi:pimeloyl-ACP methyl ester carboxylesterase
LANIYYLPGYGGRLDTGLGGALLKRGFNVSGRQTIGDFRALPFDEQVAVVAADLRHHFWRSDAQVVAISFGCYLFLHAQAQLPPFVGRVLLLSPIVGEFDHADQPVHFSPPLPNRLRELVAKGLIVEAGEGKTASGRRAVKWRVMSQEVAT